MGTDSLWEPHTPVRAPAPPTASPPPPLRPAPRPRLLRGLTIGVLSGVVLLAVGASVVLIVTERVASTIPRVDNAFAGLDEATRPPTTAALTFLLVGTDSRSETSAPGVAAGGGRSDADVVMLARIAPDRRSAVVVSIPRDSVVDIPGHGTGRLNAAYAGGGPPLLVETVETATKIRVDHFAIIDFAGFRAVVDAIDGIDVDESDAVPGLGRGPAHLDGAGALVYVRHRGTEATAEVDRGRRQQGALRAVLTRVSTTGTLTDPTRLLGLLDAVSHAVGVDDTLDNAALRTLALQLRDLRPAEVLFVRVPVAGVRDGAVTLDVPRVESLWAAVKAGTVGGYAAQNGRDALGPVTR
jgi:LCP family protein required for cell wall assembly